MSTRATIAYAKSDGSYQATYLHFDGYPEHAGSILSQRYNTIERVSALIAGGDLRSLSSNQEEPEYFPNALPPRLLHDCASLLVYARNCDANFLYVFEDNHWRCLKF
jgi:hypothetical protein